MEYQNRTTWKFWPHYNMMWIIWENSILIVLHLTELNKWPTSYCAGNSKNTQTHWTTSYLALLLFDALPLFRSSLQMSIANKKNLIWIVHKLTLNSKCEPTNFIGYKILRRNRRNSLYICQSLPKPKWMGSEDSSRI